jgi:hypothetical protein
MRSVLLGGAIEHIMLPSLTNLVIGSNIGFDWSDDLLEILKTHRQAGYASIEVTSNDRVVVATRGEPNTPFYMLVVCSLLDDYGFAISTIVPRKMIVASNRWIESNGAIGEYNQPFEYAEVQPNGGTCYNTQFYTLNIRSKLPVAVSNTDEFQQRYIRSLQLIGYLMPNVAPKLFRALSAFVSDDPQTVQRVRSETIDRMEYATHLVDMAAKQSPHVEDIQQI